MAKIPLSGYNPPERKPGSFRIRISPEMAEMIRKRREAQSEIRREVMKLVRADFEA